MGTVDKSTKANRMIIKIYLKNVIFRGGSKVLLSGPRKGIFTYFPVQLAEMSLPQCLHLPI